MARKKISQKLPEQTKNDLYEEKEVEKSSNKMIAVADCDCHKDPEIVQEIVAEPMVAVAENEPGPIEPAPLLAPVKEGEGEPRGYEASECLPWVKISRDPNKFRACVAESHKLGRIDTSKKLYNLIKDYLTSEDQECFYVIIIDTQLYVRGIAEVARGARDRVNVPISDVLRPLIVYGATAFFIAHNHPSGKFTPSQSDNELTKSVAEAAEVMGIGLFDHIIVGTDGYYSYADNNLL